MKGAVFDIGGTHTRVARVIDAVVGDVRIYNTPEKAETGLALLKDALTKAAEGETLDAIVGGVAGVIVHGELFRSPNLPGWDGALIAEVLAALAPRVEVRNDAALECLGEATAGAGKGARVVGYLSVGTGVGGARAVDGKLDEGTYNLEPGHEVLSVEGTTLEELVSGAALARDFGKKIREIPKEEYTKREAALASGIVNAILFWSPDILVLGGALMNQKDGYDLPSLIKAVRAREHMYPSLPEIRVATLGDSAGLIGAAALLREF